MTGPPMSRMLERTTGLARRSLRCRPCFRCSGLNTLADAPADWCHLYWITPARAYTPARVDHACTAAARPPAAPQEGRDPGRRVRGDDLPRLWLDALQRRCRSQRCAC